MCFPEPHSSSCSLLKPLRAPSSFVSLFCLIMLCCCLKERVMAVTSSVCVCANWSYGSDFSFNHHLPWKQQCDFFQQTQPMRKWCDSCLCEQRRLWRLENPPVHSVLHGWTGVRRHPQSPTKVDVNTYCRRKYVCSVTGPNCHIQVSGSKGSVWLRWGLHKSWGGAEWDHMTE